jgi:hypothetical protein
MRRSGFGSILADLSWHFGDVPFPSADWSDFALVVVGWWVLALVDHPDVHGAHFLFMDGPHEIWFRRATRISVVAQCVTRRIERDIVVSRFAVDPSEVCREVLRVASDILRECDIRGWRSRDVDVLREGLSGLGISHG